MPVLGLCIGGMAGALILHTRPYPLQKGKRDILYTACGNHTIWRYLAYCSIGRISLTVLEKKAPNTWFANTFPYVFPLWNHDHAQCKCVLACACACMCVCKPVLVPHPQRSVLTSPRITHWIQKHSLCWYLASPSLVLRFLSLIPRD